MVTKDTIFQTTKKIIESQILNTLDFLFTDNQLNEVEVIRISRQVLSDIDTTQNTSDLFKNVRRFVNQNPLFKDNLQKTIASLNQSYGS